MQYRVATPSLYFVDVAGGKLFMEYLADAITVKQHLYDHGVDVVTHADLLRQIGEALSRLHAHNIVHGVRLLPASSCCRVDAVVTFFDLPKPYRNCVCVCVCVCTFVSCIYDVCSS